MRLRTTIVQKPCVERQTIILTPADLQPTSRATLPLRDQYLSTSESFAVACKVNFKYEFDDHVTLSCLASLNVNNASLNHGSPSTAFHDIYQQVRHPTIQNRRPISRYDTTIAIDTKELIKDAAPAKFSRQSAIPNDYPANALPKPVSMTTLVRTRIPLETLSMSQPTSRRRSKRIAGTIWHELILRRGAHNG